LQTFVSRPKAAPQSVAPRLETAPIHGAEASRATTDAGRDFAAPGEPRLRHDFSRISVSGPAIQCKLAVSSPGDSFEREADVVADRVMRMEASPSIGAAPPMIHRKCSNCEEEKQALEGREDESLDTQRTTIFRKAAPFLSAAPAPVTSQRLAASRTGGAPLAPATRARMENSFGHDFSRVRIHYDAEAGAMSRQISALAFTHGSHIYFQEGGYHPDTSDGKRLLAHELTHVIQQGEAPRQSQGGDRSGDREPGRTSSSVLQRTATWGGAAVHETNNLVDVFLSGAVVGITVQQLNGTALGSTAGARGALVSPTLAFASAASGGVNAKVASVPTNTGSSDETVLGSGPWTRVVPKATVGAAFPALTACTGAATSTFRAKGRPDDAAMKTSNRRHEDHHVADHHAVFDATVGAWDTRLAAAAAAGTAFNGPTQADAVAALHAAMGGTPNQIADALFNNRIAAAQAFHATAAGGNVTLENPTANADCTTSEVTSFNPS
jgi:hypothetical protein